MSALICPGCKKPLQIRLDRLALLPPFKRKLATMLAEGKTQTEAAALLGKRRNCITSHVDQIRNILPIQSARGITLYLYGLIDFEEEHK